MARAEHDQARAEYDEAVQALARYLRAFAEEHYTKDVPDITEYDYQKLQRAADALEAGTLAPSREFPLDHESWGLIK